VLAVADRDAARRDRVAGRLHVPYRVPDIEAVLALNGIDAVGVAVPPQSHAEVAIAALEAGKHVWIDKPLALSAEECLRICQAAAGNSRVVMNGFHMRFHRLVGGLHAAIRSGRLGKIESIRSVWNSPRADLDLPAWRQRRATGGGALIEIGVHHFDLWRYLLDAEVREVFAVARDGERDDENAIVTAVMENGVLATAMLSERTSHEIEIEVCGSAGRVRASCLRFEGLEFLGVAELPGAPRARLKRLAHFARELPLGLVSMSRGGEYRDSYRAAWDSFARAAQGRAPAVCGPAEGLRAVEVVAAAVQSRLTHAPVTLRRVELPAPAELAPAPAALCGAELPAPAELAPAPVALCGAEPPACPEPAPAPVALRRTELAGPEPASAPVALRRAELPARPDPALAEPEPAPAPAAEPSAEAASPFFSVVVPTFNRPAALAKLLDALCLQNYPRGRFEVVLVNDGGGCLDDVVAPFRSRLQIQLLSQNRAGCAGARQWGAAHAANRWLAFTDDDCRPAYGWLKHLEETCLAAPACAAGGRVFNGLRGNLFSEATQVMLDYLDSQFNGASEGRYFPTNNLAFPAEAFAAMGGLDPLWPVAGGEDRDLCARWLRAGYGIVRSEGAVVLHYHELKLATYWRQHFNYGRGSHLFRARLDAPGRPAPPLEPLGFYLCLPLFPFRRYRLGTAARLAALLAVAQAANALGFVWQAVRERRGARDAAGAPVTLP
jgi:predicted dehydrogenase/GT2 family glycosyltransferase